MRRSVSVAVLIALVLAVFWPLRHHPFIDLDDAGYVLHNRAVLGGLSWENVKWAFTSTSLTNWHPLTWLSHMTDVDLLGLDAGKHHMMSLGLHAANTAALFLVLRSLTGAWWGSWVVAALFGVHPLHVESVAWVAERKDVLSGLFWMLGMASYVWFARRGGVWRYGVTTVVFALGLMAKPMLVTLPLVFLLLDWWPLGRFRAAGARAVPGAAASRLVIEKLPLLLLSAASSAVTWVAQREGGAINLPGMFSLGERASNAVRSSALYLVKLMCPAGLSVYYPFPNVREIPWQIFASGVLLTALTVVAIFLRRKQPWLLMGWCWYLGTLIPVIGLVKVGGQAMADRYSYLTLSGLFVATVWSARSLARTARRVTVLSAATVVVIVGLSATSRHQVAYWRNSEVLFSHAAQVTTDNWMAHFILGDILVDQGRVEEAISHYREAARIFPRNAAIRAEFGMALEKSGRRAEGLIILEEAVRLDPRNAEAHNNLGALLYSAGRVGEALVQFQEALRIKPDFVAAQRNYRLAAMYRR